MALAIATTSTYVSGGATTTHAVTLPSGIASGDLLLMFFGNNGTAGPTGAPTGWTEIFSNVYGDTEKIYARISDGTDGATASITLGSSLRAAAICYRITGAHGGVTSSDIAVSASVDANTSTPDPPSLTPSWGSDANLWVAIDYSNSGAQAATGWPTNYTLAQLNAMEGTGVGTGVSTAARALTAASDDPGVFTHSGALQRSAVTLAVRPAAAGKSVVADAGSYAMTGSAAGVKHGWKVAAGVGSYAMTGAVAGVKHGWKVPAGVGSYSMSGSVAGIVHGWKLPAGVGSYTLTGAAAGIAHGWKVPAGVGAYAMTGAAAAIKHGWAVPAGVGAYSMSGSASGVLHGWKVAAGTASYTMTGVDAVISKTANKVLSAGPGSYAMAGQTAGVVKGWKVLAGVASYDMVGSDAALTYTPASSGTSGGIGGIGWGGEVPPVHRQGDTRWDGVREAREAARRLFDELPATPVPKRKEAAVRASEAVAEVAKNVSLTYSPITLPDVQPLLDQLEELQALLSGMALQQERIRREQEREAADRWQVIEMVLRDEMARAQEEELMVVLALAL